MWHILHYRSTSIDGLQEKWIQQAPTWMKQPLKKIIANKQMLYALEGLLSFPGLWPDLSMNSFRRMSALKCDEVTNRVPPWPKRPAKCVV